MVKIIKMVVYNLKEKKEEIFLEYGGLKINFGLIEG